MARRVLIGLTWVALVACEPSIPEATLLCRRAEATSLTNCPPGFFCCAAPEREGFDGVCHRGGCDGGTSMEDTDAGAGVDAGFGASDGGARRDAGTADAGLSAIPTHVAAGAAHTCARWSDDRLFCWGSNVDGRLGNGEIRVAEPETAPVEVVNAPSGVEQLALGGSHSCARTADAVYCWGSNADGQLGDRTVRTFAERPSRAALPSALTPIALGAGQDHACAVVTGGAVFCWGRNHAGQLGQPLTVASSPTPLEVPGIDRAAEVVAGLAHTCVRRTDGAVWCWGRNVQRELGRSGFTDAFSELPASVNMLGGPASRLAAGARHTCAVVDDEVRCWGAGGNGQLGQGEERDAALPVTVMALPARPARLAGGGTATVGHTCAGGPGLAAHCWGARISGQLGDGMWLSNRSVAAPVSTLGAAPSDLTAGGEHTCAIVGGAVLCWGKNTDGQLGDGTTTTVNRPTPIVAPR